MAFDGVQSLVPILCDRHAQYDAEEQCQNQNEQDEWNFKNFRRKQSRNDSTANVMYKIPPIIVSNSKLNKKTVTTWRMNVIIFASPQHSPKILR